MPGHFPVDRTQALMVFAGSLFLFECIYARDRLGLKALEPLGPLVSFEERGETVL